MGRYEAVLALTDVSLRYGDRSAVEDLSLCVRPGEVVGLLGANGSGKSTTLSACAGLLQPVSGAIRLCGLCPQARPLDYRRNLGYVPQELALYEELSGRENLLFFGRMYGLTGRELRHRATEALDFVRLADRADHLAGTYSGGMQRRLNLACALLHRPALLLLDEPTVGLDIASREAIQDCLTLLRDSGTSILYTTHHLDEAEMLCDRLAILRGGQLVAQGSMAEIAAGLESDDLESLPVALYSRLVRSSRLEPILRHFGPGSLQNS